jgi:hypothetical protein
MAVVDVGARRCVGEKYVNLAVEDSFPELTPVCVTALESVAVVPGRWGKGGVDGGLMGGG